MLHGRNYSATFMMVFLGLALGTALTAAWSCRHALERQDFSQIVSGATATAYEDKFDAALWFEDMATKLWGAAQYGLVGQGKPGVVIGEDGWLFTAEEFTHYPAENVQKRMEEIAITRDSLNKEGVDLVVVLVPAKARMYAENYPSYYKDQYSEVLAGLRVRNVVVADILAAFDGKEGMFLKADTHWGPAGAKIAAQEVGKITHVKHHQAFVTKEGKAVAHEGDLLRYIPRLEREQPEEIMSFITSAKNAKQDLFGEQKIPVTLVGTSYSFNKLWNFEGALKQALRADVLNAADEGLGPFATMRKYLSSETFKTHRPELVVWEIPERYLPMPEEDL